jgi:hypothetical protein
MPECLYYPDQNTLKKFKLFSFPHRPGIFSTLVLTRQHLHNTLTFTTHPPSLHTNLHHTPTFTTHQPSPHTNLHHIPTFITNLRIPLTNRSKSYLRIRDKRVLSNNRREPGTCSLTPAPYWHLLLNGNQVRQHVRVENGWMDQWRTNKGAIRRLGD